MDTFELRWRRRLLRVPWTARRSNQSQAWIFIGRTDAETLAPILWPPDVKGELPRKDSDAGKDWGQEMKGVTEAEMVGWHHRLKLGMLLIHGVAKSWTWLSDWMATDVRKYKNWVHRVSSWKYLTIWRPVLPVFPGAPRFCSPLWIPFKGCWKSAAAVAHNLIFVEADGKCQSVADVA